MVCMPGVMSYFKAPIPSSSKGLSLRVLCQRGDKPYIIEKSLPAAGGGMKMRPRTIACNGSKPLQCGQQRLFLILQIESCIKPALQVINKLGISLEKIGSRVIGFPLIKWEKLISNELTKKSFLIFGDSSRFVAGSFEKLHKGVMAT